MEKLRVRQDSHDFIAVVRINSSLERLKPYHTLFQDILHNPHIKGVIFHVNCFGGNTGTGEALLSELNRLKEHIPIVTFIENNCYSAAYYIPAASDCIIALPSSVVGSIGTTTTIEKHSDIQFHTENESGQVELITITAGKHKSAHCVSLPLSEEQRSHIQDTCNQLYDRFITNIAWARNLAIDEHTRWADGQEFTGIKAKELRLVDELGDFTFAIEKMRELLAQRGIQNSNELAVIEIAEL